MTNNLKKIATEVGKKTSLDVVSCYMILCNTFDVISEHIAKGQDVTIDNFGTFGIAKKPQKKVYNFKSKEFEILPERLAVKFKLNEKIKKQLESIKI